MKVDETESPNMANTLDLFRGVREEDLRRAAIYTAAGKETTATRDLLIRRLAVFSADHVAHGITSDLDIMTRFFGRLQSIGLSSGTIECYSETMRTWSIYPSNLTRLQARVDMTDLHRGIARVSGQEKKADKRCGISQDDIWALITRQPRDGARDLTYRTLLALTMVTGNRLTHIYQAQRFSIQDEGVRVRWGKRKSYEAMKNTLLYKFSWSREPPDDIIQVIRGHTSKDWGLPAKHTGIASAMDSWLRKRAEKHELTRVTSSIGRGSCPRRCTASMRANS